MTQKSEPHVRVARLPLNEISIVLFTERLSQSRYIKTTSEIRRWQLRHYGSTYPISLSKQELETMEFVDYQLSDDEKSACSTWSELPSTDLLEEANNICADGYRITFTRDKKNSCVVVTVIGKTVGNSNDNRGMSTRHATIEIALLMAVYKHIEIFNGGEWSESDPQSMFG